jgi:hypothetical protein
MLVKKKPFAVLMLLAAACAPTMAGAQEPRENHGYGGGGLVLVSGNTQTPGGDFNSTGGGIVFTGAGIFDLGTLGVGVTGEMAFGGRTDDDSDAEISDALVAFDGGMIVADMLYLSLGVHVLGQTFEDVDITTTYTVVPLGIGFIKGDDKGYFLGQIRFGAGTATNDFDSSEDDIGYFGIRLVGQTGMANGVQFMGGMELDAYDLKDSDVTDNFFRIFAGVAFGT